MGLNATFNEMQTLVSEGWTFRVTRLTEEFTFQDWRAERPEARLIGRISRGGEIKLIRKDEDAQGAPDVRIIALRPPEDAGEQPPPDAKG